MKTAGIVGGIVGGIVWECIMVTTTANSAQTQVQGVMGSSVSL